MFSIISSVLGIFMMISIGYFLTNKRWLNDEINKNISRIIINISLPSLMISNISTRFNRQELIMSSTGILFTFLGILASYLLALLISNLLRISDNKKGIFCVMFTFSNTIFIGMPVNLALYGEGSIIYVLLYYLANTILFWTIGVYKLRASKENLKNDKNNLDIVKKIFTPPLMGFIVGILIVMLDIRLPNFLLDTLKDIGGLTTPLSMFFTGSVIKSLNIKNIKMDINSYIILLGKFIITPLIIYLILTLTDFPVLLKKVFIIEASMPILTQAIIVSKFYNVETEYITIMVTLTTLISLLLLPVYSILLNIAFV